MPVPVPQWFVAEAGNFGLLFLQFLLTVVIAAIMYAGGESAAAWMKRFGQRLAGERGADVVVLAGQAIRGVALGVVVTAVVQSVLGGIGLAIAGVPMAAVLTVLMFMLCIAQLGVFLVLLPAVAWLYWSGDNGWGTFLLVWTLVVGSLDNVLRPYLIKKGADLPLLLIFAGVIGGMITFGLVGIFVGPVVLAVAYTLIDAWVGGRFRTGACHACCEYPDGRRSQASPLGHRAILARQLNRGSAAPRAGNPAAGAGRPGRCWSGARRRCDPRNCAAW